jgi:TPR repeat protein
VYTAIAAEDYRYSAQPEVENAKWQERVGRLQDNATLGDPLAMAGLSIALAKGLGTARNPDEARRWAFESAYSERHPAGLFALAELYEQGIGVEKNEIAADRLRGESAEGGFPPAMADIARTTLRNSGATTSQKISAIATLEKAAAAGFVGAKADLGMVYSGTVAGLPADPQKAFEMTRDAAEDGIPSAMTNMFRIYMAGFPPVVQSNVAVARDWLVKAAEQGYSPAQVFLALAYYQKGNFNYVQVGLPQNFPAARKWSELAARQGDADAMVLLAEMEKLGDGGPVNLSKSREWLEKAKQHRKP